MRWHVREWGTVSEVKERRVRRRLQSGTYTGLEHVRPENSDQWVPLYSTALFREEVPVDVDGDAETVAVRRGLWGPMSTLWIVMSAIITGGILIGFIAAVGEQAPLPGLLGILFGWFVSMAAMLPLAGKRFAAHRHLRRRRRGVSPAQFEPVESKYVREAREALDRLDARRASLEELLATSEREALESELATVESQLAAATRETTKQAHEDHRRAIQARLEGLHDAEEALAGIEARQKALRHQLADLQLALTRAEPAQETPELNAQLDRIRGELDAAGEIEEHVMKARRAALAGIKNRR